MPAAPPLPRLVCVVALAACSAAGCSSDAPPGATGPAARGAATAAAPLEVVTAAVERRPMATDIEAIGTALARESVQVTSNAANRITAIHFAEGQTVRRGAVLVTLDGAEERAAVAEAEAALTESESQFRRSRELVAQQALSASQLDTIESALKANRARLAAARARLEDTVIRAGFDGHTGFRQVSVGALVAPGTVITTLDDTSVIKVNFTVPEAQLPAVRVGLAIEATTVGVPGRRFNGKVTNLDSRVDPVSRSLLVRAEIPNRDGALRPGLFMTVRLSGAASQALVVPEAAIVPERGESFVFVVAEGRAERRAVRTGRRRPGEVEIVAGLEAGERIVVEGTQHVMDGGAVTEQRRDEAGQAAAPASAEPSVSADASTPPSGS
jgi:membrane fusion protein, multidrug efflux system